jgi:Cd2+/Zn2+-exporting ATPase
MTTYLPETNLIFPPAPSLPKPKEESCHNKFDDSDTAKCVLCDSTSKVPHTIEVTRLRVANLCCVLEENLVHAVLSKMNGVEKATVNTIGKYVIVRHCRSNCCAPTSKIVAALNEKRLGASVQEVGTDDDDGRAVGLLDEFMNSPRIWLLCLTITFFIAGCIWCFPSSFSSTRHDNAYVSLGLFVTGTFFGLLPILRAAVMSLMRGGGIDVHTLMMVAIIGALATEEYFDANLLVALFSLAEHIEEIAMKKVRKAIQLTVVKMPKTAFLVRRESKVASAVSNATDSVAAAPSASSSATLAKSVVLRGLVNLKNSNKLGESQQDVVKSNRTVDVDVEVKVDVDDEFDRLEGSGAGASISVERLRIGDVIAARTGDMVSYLHLNRS